MLLAQASPNDLFAQLISAITDFRTAKYLVGMVLFVHVLITISKIPSISSKINAAARPVIAVGLGIIGGVLSCLASGSNFQVSLELGIPAGITAAGGSVVLHEAAQSIQMFWTWLTRNKKPAGLTVVAFLFLFPFGAKADTTPGDVSPAHPIQVLPLVESSNPVVPPPPQPVTTSTFGGCNKLGTFCYGPWVSISLMDINLTTGKIEPSFAPGVGYGFTMFKGQPYSVGFALLGNANPANQQASLAGLFSFFNGYVDLGPAKSFINDHSWRLLVGINLPIPTL